jgi:HEAT repeat protein
MVRVAMTLLLLMLARPAAAQDDLRGLVADLGGKDSNRRIAALNELRRRKDPDTIPLVLAALPGFEHTGRYYGILVLESYPPALANRAFRTLLSDESPFLRLCAGAALFRNGETKAVGVVVKALGEEVAAPAMVNMLNRVHGVKHPAVRKAVRSLLRPDQDISVISSAVYVLHSQLDRDALAACRELLEKDGRGGVRALAAAYLYRFGEVERAADLAREIRGGKIGSTEYFRIETMLKASSHVAVEILDALADALEEETNASVLARVISLLADFRHRKAIPAIRELLTHENRMVAKAAFDALASIPGALDGGALRPLLDSEDADRRLWAADALRRMDDLIGLPKVIEILKTGTYTQRYEAARILGGFRVAAAVGPLIEALSDEHTSVRNYAATGLAALLRSLYPYRRFDLQAAGYDCNAPEATRRAAAKRIRAWWITHRDRDW